MSISVRLEAGDLARARALADASYMKFANSPGYYRNTPNSHVIGKIGEIAAENLMKSANLPVRSLYEDPYQIRSADLQIGDIRLEVKTWTNDYWTDWGRCVAVGQLATLRQKCDCVIWVSATTADHSAQVFFHGWSTLQDIAMAPIRWTGPSGRQVKNHQLELGSLRDVSELLEALQSHDRRGFQLPEN